MYIETLIEKLAIFGRNLEKWDQGIVLSFYTQTTKGVGFTEKQTNLAIAILKKYASQLCLLCKTDITPSVDYPTYRYPIRKLNLEKKISIVPHLNFSKVIKLEFPFNEKLINHIKANKSKLSNVFWDADQKSWFFELNEKNILYVVELTKIEQFDIDQEFTNYVNQIDNIIKNLENYVPMLTLSNEKFEYKNAHPDVPSIESDDILSATFEARKRGIFTWDDEISNFIESEKVNPTTRLFLKSPTDYTLRISDNCGSMDCLKDIILNTLPVLFVIPGGRELEKMQRTFNFLKKIGITNEEISVMFRLPSDIGKDFNDFVKNNHLNSAISEKTKIVAISGKFPKPIIKSKIKFHSIVNLGFENVHYTMRDFVLKHENLLYFYETTNHPEINFGNL